MYLKTPELKLTDTIRDPNNKILWIPYHNVVFTLLTPQARKQKPKQVSVDAYFTAKLQDPINMPLMLRAYAKNTSSYKTLESHIVLQPLIHDPRETLYKIAMSYKDIEKAYENAIDELAKVKTKERQRERGGLRILKTLSENVARLFYGGGMAETMRRGMKHVEERVRTPKYIEYKIAMSLLKEVFGSSIEERSPNIILLSSETIWRPFQIVIENNQIVFIDLVDKKPRKDKIYTSLQKRDSGFRNALEEIGFSKVF